MDVRRAAGTGREVLGQMRRHNLTFMAGSVAHSAFLSLLPLLLLVLVIATAVGNDVLADRITEMAELHLSPAGEGLVFDALVNASERAGASVVGVVSLVWGMLRIFRGLNTAFDQLYAAGESSLAEQVVDGLVGFLAVAVATVGTGGATALLAPVEHPVATALNPVVLVAGLAAAFYPMISVNLLIDQVNPSPTRCTTCFPSRTSRHARRCRGPSSPRSAGRSWRSASACTSAS